MEKFDYNGQKELHLNEEECFVLLPVVRKAEENLRNSYKNFMHDYDHADNNVVSEISLALEYTQNLLHTMEDIVW